MTAKVTYQLTDDNAIDIKYSATTDKKTIINMTNHSYFNLAGDPSKTSTDNIMYVNADYYTPVDSTFMTTGEIVPVKDTPMDFTTPKAVGKDINNYDFVQLKNGNGYDHNWVLKNKGNFEKVAELMAEESGIVMETYTDRPGMQIYTANFVENEVGKEGVVYGKRSAVCLETQCYPDAVHHENFPSPVYRAGEKYTAHTAFRFLIKK